MKNENTKITSTSRDDWLREQRSKRLEREREENENLDFQSLI